MSSSDNAELIEYTGLNFFLINGLLNESKINGYDFIQKTIDEWNSGVNQFSKPGEKLWGLVLATDLIAIGGINRDPYVEDINIGRVRHLYIQEAHRRKGYATLLMNAIINKGRQHFNVLRLFTDNPAASEF